MLLTPLLCLALNLYHEARSDPVESQLAVAFVTLNRAEQRASKVCDVVFEKSQFSWTTGTTRRQAYDSVKRLNKTEEFKLALNLSRRVLAKEIQDTTHGSRYFHLPKVKPKWAKSPELKRVAKIGSHIYYARVEDLQQRSLSLSFDCPRGLVSYECVVQRLSTPYAINEYLIADSR